MRTLCLSAALLLLAVAVAAQPTDANRRVYHPTRAFLQNTDPNCFDATLREADRAFGQRCWEDAARLYRAAKICDDANQQRRLDMNARLEACRAAAEQEIINRERLAIAANRANDAQKLLQGYNRTLAYRMADFANQFIAPPGESSPEGLQALLDTRYAPVNIGGGDTKMPLSYELKVPDERVNLAELKIRISPSKIYAFAAKQQRLFIWDAKTLEPLEPMELSENVQGFEVSPDGRILFFHNQNTLVFLLSSGDLITLNVPRVHRYCFDSNGTEFYLMDTLEHKIEALALRSDRKYAQRNQSARKNGVADDEGLESARLRPFVSGVPAGLLDFKVHEGRVWLGYRDQLLILEKSGTGKPWKTFFQKAWKDTVGLGQMGQPAELRLSPAQNLVCLSNDTATYLKQLILKEDGYALEERRLSGAALAFGNTGSAYLTEECALVAVARRELAIMPEYVDIFATCYADKPQFRNAAPQRSYPVLFSGAISPDHQWAVLPVGGRLQAMRLPQYDEDHISLAASPKHRPDAAGLLTLHSMSDEMGLLNTGSSLHVFPLRDLESEPVKFPIPEGLRLVGNPVKAKSWVLMALDSDSLLAWNWAEDQQFRVPLPARADRCVWALSPDVQYFAVADSNSVLQYSLPEGREVASQRFEGAAIRQMVFVPQSRELALLQGALSEYYNAETPVVRIVSLLDQGYRPRTLRLHGYNTRSMVFSENGAFLALSDQMDIRFFRMDDLENELSQALPQLDKIEKYPIPLNDMAFLPNSRALAALYRDGSLVIWGIQNGQPEATLSAPSSYVVTDQLAISEAEQSIYLGGQYGSIRRISLSFDDIYQAMQPLHHRLLAFDVEDIRRYNLDQAMGYLGNFERLAASGDDLLIRAFFDYYAQEAYRSNNIHKVAQYCERASILYEGLDEATQRQMRPLMIALYENYLWKWLIRGELGEAQRVLAQLRGQYGTKPGELVSEAHLALLQPGGDALRKAANAYVEWALDPEKNNLSYTRYFEPPMDDLAQLAEFGLLDEPRIQCLCALFGPWDQDKLCKNRPLDDAALPLERVPRLRWQVFRNLRQVQEEAEFSQSMLCVARAREAAQALSALKPELGRSYLQHVDATEAWACEGEAGFENNSPRGIRLHRRSMGLLAGKMPDAKMEQQRLSMLLGQGLVLGRHFLQVDSLALVQGHCEQGLKNAQELAALAQSDSMASEFQVNQHQADFYLLMGEMQLRSGQVSAARSAFEQANNLMVEGLNSLYMGYADLLEGDSEAALLNFGGILTAEQLGDALDGIETLAARFPDKADSLRAFMPRLRSAWMRLHPRSNAAETDYRLAVLQSRTAFLKGQYRTAARRNLDALRCAEGQLAREDAPVAWLENWGSALLNQSFYLLFQSKNDDAALDAAIEYAEEGTKRSAQLQERYGYESPALDNVPTNLAHAYWLRNRPGDRDKAIAAYEAYLSVDEADQFERWRLLQKDFRDLYAAGIQLPDLRALVLRIYPAASGLLAEEWREMGVVQR
jgi:WD40 repeat protein